MQFVAALPHNRHQIRIFQQPKMFRHRLPGHLQADAKLAQRLPVILFQPVQQLSAGRIGQRFEHLVHKKLYATVWLHVKIGLSRAKERPEFSFVCWDNYSAAFRAKLRRRITTLAPASAELPRYSPVSVLPWIRGVHSERALRHFRRKLQAGRPART